MINSSFSKGFSEGFSLGYKQGTILGSTETCVHIMKNYCMGIVFRTGDIFLDEYLALMQSAIVKHPYYSDQHLAEKIIFSSPFLLRGNNASSVLKELLKYIPHEEKK
ncbi:MAG: hypothetical protein ACI4LN_03390 [Anaerovoracaceae bacterium]